MNEELKKRRNQRHYIKCEKKYFQAVVAHKKNFEIRYNDRDYQKGDILFIDEVQNETYTGNHTIRRVKYVLKNCPEYGLKKGFCILGF